MPTIDEIDAKIAELRDLKKVIKRSGKNAIRKVATLRRRRERLLEQIRLVDEQIANLEREASSVTPPVPGRRGRRPKSAA